MHRVMFFDCWIHEDIGKSSGDIIQDNISVFLSFRIASLQAENQTRDLHITKQDW